MAPPSWSTSPATMSRKVDLPQPLGPTMVKISPARTSILTFSKASVSRVAPLPKRLLARYVLRTASARIKLMALRPRRFTSCLADIRTQHETNHLWHFSSGTEHESKAHAVWPHSSNSAPRAATQLQNQQLSASVLASTRHPPKVSI